MQGESHEAKCTLGYYSYFLWRHDICIKSHIVYYQDNSPGLGALYEKYKAKVTLG